MTGREFGNLWGGDSPTARARTTRELVAPKTELVPFLSCLFFACLLYFFVIYRASSSFRDEPDAGTSCRLHKEEESVCVCGFRGAPGQMSQRAQARPCNGTFLWCLSSFLFHFFFPANEHCVLVYTVVERVYRYILLLRRPW